MKIDSITIKKENKKTLTYEEIKYVVDGYVKNEISDKDMSKFLMAVYNNSLNSDETYYLTDVMIKSGKTMDLSKLKKPIVDKHSTGGIGDKTTLIVAPIVASLGLAVAKMSGRSLGFTGGTIDKLESIEGYNVKLSMEKFLNNVNNIGIGVISQSEDVAVADKKIYALRDEIGAVNSMPLIASSIMSKKIASGSPSIVIDLKVGAGAFMKTIEDAAMLAKIMIKIGKRYKRKVICILTNMDYPLGYTIGNALEVEEAVEFFNGHSESRLKELVINISANMISLGKKVNLIKAKSLVLRALKDGSAKNKFYEWIASQGGNANKLKNEALKMIVTSEKDGYINNIDPLSIASLVSSLGAGRKNKEDDIDYAVGVRLNKTIGDHVMKGDILGTIFYNKIEKNVNNIFMDSFVIEKNKKKIKKIIIKKIK